MVPATRAVVISNTGWVIVTDAVAVLKDASTTPTVYDPAERPVAVTATCVGLVDQAYV
jgi:hypothetical protein